MSRIRSVLYPHTPSVRDAEKRAAIYRQGRTPEVGPGGRVTALDVRPGGPEMAARHLGQVWSSHGAAGVRQTVAGLQRTRGNQFVARMMAGDNTARTLAQASADRGVPGPVRRALAGSGGGTSLPGAERSRIEAHFGEAPPDVRVHDTPAAHEAAASIGARAFTVGSRIFFGRGEYAPHHPAGRALLAHEVTHAYQQRGAAMPSPDSLRISSPGDGHERQAESAARRAASVPAPAARPAAASDGMDVEDAPLAASELGRVGEARVQRAITFTTNNVAPTTSPVTKEETAAWFRLLSAGSPGNTFVWAPEVTIHGNAGDPFADWETAHHQVGKNYAHDIYWGTGTNRTHRAWRVDGGLPMRDATAAGNTWYSDWRAQSFAANGDMRAPVMRDGPQTAGIPWNNPVAGRTGNSGSFNYSFGFVTTLSARHKPGGTGSAAFRHLNNMHWGFAMAGTFDASLAVGSRVSITTPGTVTHSAMNNGVDPAFPPMHGGAIINDKFRYTDT